MKQRALLISWWKGSEEEHAAFCPQGAEYREVNESQHICLSWWIITPGQDKQESSSNCPLVENSFSSCSFMIVSPPRLQFVWSTHEKIYHHQSLGAAAAPLGNEFLFWNNWWRYLFPNWGKKIKIAKDFTDLKSRNGSVTVWIFAAQKMEDFTPILKHLFIYLYSMRHTLKIHLPSFQNQMQQAVQSCKLCY